MLKKLCLLFFILFAIKEYDDGFNVWRTKLEQG